MENTIPVHSITSHKGLYELIHSMTAIGTPRLRGEMMKVRDCLVLKEIYTLSWLRSDVMLANRLIKKTANPKEMMRILHSGARTRQEVNASTAGREIDEDQS